MWDLIKAGGWLMLPIIACSVIAMAIVLERLWALRRSRVLPPQLVQALHKAVEGNALVTAEGLLRLSGQSPLGRLLSAGVANYHLGREVVKESLEDCGRQVVHDLERYLNALGTIASVAPLLGLLGTVFGMIEVFNVIATQGNGNIALLSDGIAKALITTAGGLTVAIPSLLFYRYLRARVDELVLRMEAEAILLVDIAERLASRDTLPPLPEQQVRRRRS